MQAVASSAISYIRLPISVERQKQEGRHSGNAAPCSGGREQQRAQAVRRRRPADSSGSGLFLLGEAFLVLGDDNTGVHSGSEELGYLTDRLLLSAKLLDHLSHRVTVEGDPPAVWLRA